MSTPLHKIAARLVLALLVAVQPALVALGAAGEGHGCGDGCCCAELTPGGPAEVESATEPSCCSTQVEPDPAPAAAGCTCKLRSDPAPEHAPDLAPVGAGPSAAEQVARGARASATTPLAPAPAHASALVVEAEPPLPLRDRAESGAPGALARRLADRGVDALLSHLGAFLR